MSWVHGPEIFSGLISTTRSIEKKPFSATAKNQLQLVATGFAVIPYSQGVTEGPLAAVFRSPLMKALDKSVETLGL